MTSLAERLALARQTTENFERTESTQDALKNESNTNIRVNSENAPNTQETTAPVILSLAERLEQRKTTQTPQNSAQSITQHIQSASKRLTFAERMALQKATQEEVLDQFTVEPEQAKTENKVEEEKTTVTYPDSKLQTSLFDRVREAALARAQVAVEEQKPLNEVSVEEVAEKVESFSLDIVLNLEQRAAVEMIKKDQSCVLIGSAGSGKTTTEREIAKAVLNSPKIKTIPMRVSGDDYVDAPSVAIVAATRRAANNSAKAILKDPELRQALPNNIMTIHKLLEYQPEYYIDATDGYKEKFRFSPQRTAARPLEITHLLIEEASLVGLDIWEKLFDALLPGVVIMYIGDINQLPPVFGASILSYAMTKLPVVELVEVYRQGEGSPVINTAQRILKGEKIFTEINEQGSFRIIQGNNQQSLGQLRTSLSLGQLLKKMYEMKQYDPDEDIVLSPWNVKDCGTINMNNHIAQFLGSERNAIVHEVIAGNYTRLYLAEGDKVMYEKRDAIIVKIERNIAYMGQEPKLAGTDLTRFGSRILGDKDAIHEEIDLDGADYSNFSIEELEENAADRVMQASHAITIAYDDGFTQTLKAVGELNPSVFQLGYCLSVHKSQGSEWNRVFFIFHKDHTKMVSREMLYTAVTRARTDVVVFAKMPSIETAMKAQRLKGNTLKDKIEYFNSGIEQNDSIQVTK
jgi:ATP-dependent exoDNAse (exonuclease V) alpha subunit